MTEFRVLTLWQPWASLIALGLKQYETRSWDVNYRGKLAIHAAKRPFVSSYGLPVKDYAAWTTWIDSLELAHEMGVINDQSKLPFSHQLPLGSIVAIVDLTSTLQMMDIKKIGGMVHLHPHLNIAINSVSHLERTVGDWREDRYAWKLENVIALPEPIPYKGGQGLRKLQDPEIIQQLESFIHPA